MHHNNNNTTNQQKQQQHYHHDEGNDDDDGGDTIVAYTSLASSPLSLLQITTKVVSSNDDFFIVTKSTITNNNTMTTDHHHSFLFSTSSPLSSSYIFDPTTTTTSDISLVKTTSVTTTTDNHHHHSNKIGNVLVTSKSETTAYHDDDNEVSSRRLEETMNTNNDNTSLSQNEICNLNKMFKNKYDEIRTSSTNTAHSDCGMIDLSESSNDYDHLESIETPHIEHSYAQQDTIKPIVQLKWKDAKCTREEYIEPHTDLKHQQDEQYQRNDSTLLKTDSDEKEQESFTVRISGFVDDIWLSCNINVQTENINKLQQRRQTFMIWYREHLELLFGCNLQPDIQPATTLSLSWYEPIVTKKVEQLHGIIDNVTKQFPQMNGFVDDISLSCNINVQDINNVQQHHQIFMIWYSEHLKLFFGCYLQQGIQPETVLSLSLYEQLLTNKVEQPHDCRGNLEDDTKQFLQTTDISANIIGNLYCKYREYICHFVGDSETTVFSIAGGMILVGLAIGTFTRKWSWS